MQGRSFFKRFALQGHNYVGIVMTYHQVVGLLICALAAARDRWLDGRQQHER
jgi:hypothetical protein